MAADLDIGSPGSPGGQVERLRVFDPRPGAAAARPAPGWPRGAAIAAQAQAFVATLADRTLALVTGIGGWFLEAGVALFTLFYLLRDGERLLSHLQRLIPRARI